MEKLFIGALCFLIIISCSSPKVTDEQEYQSEVSQQSPPENGVVTSSPVVDSLNREYQKRGFESFCEVKADADSIFLTADYMAGIALGEDNFSQERTKLTSRIEKDRIAAYVKKRGLDYKVFIDDLFLLAMEYPNPCEAYLKYRYDTDKAMIRNERSLHLHQDVYMNYK